MIGALPAGAAGGIGRLLQQHVADIDVERVTLYGLRDPGSEPNLVVSSSPPDTVNDLVFVCRVIDRYDRVVDNQAPVKARSDPNQPGAVGSRRVLALPAISDAGETLGVLLVRSSAPRSWTSQDLDRCEAIASAMGAVLVIDELRVVAEARRDFEKLRRKLRVHLHSIAVEASSATTLGSLAGILVRNSPDLVGASWGVSLVRASGESKWVYDSDGANDQVVAQLRSAPLLDGVELSCTDRVATIEPGDLTNYPTLRQSLKADGISYLIRLDLADAGTDLEAVVYLGLDAPSVSEHTMLLVAELADDASIAVDRVARTQHQARIASTLQRSLLPPRIPRIDGFDIRQLYNSAADFTRVGGDWYDVVVIDENRTAFVVGDVAGHDVRSAAVMGQLRHVVASQLRDERTPAAALEATDSYFADLDENVMATVVVMQIDKQQATATICLAGHPPPVVVDDDNAQLVTAKPGPPVGFGFGGYVDTEVALRPGTTIVAYTDGLVEQRAGSITEHLTELVTSIAAAPRTIDALMSFLAMQAKAGSLIDDVAVLVVRYDP